MSFFLFLVCNFQFFGVILINFLNRLFRPKNADKIAIKSLGKKVNVEPEFYNQRGFGIFLNYFTFLAQMKPFKYGHILHFF